MQVHVGLPQFLVFVAYLIIAGFFLRVLAARYSERPLGKALSFIY